MKNNFVKIFAVLVTSLSIFCAGCFQGESNLTIDDNGKVTLKNELMGVPLMRDAIEGFKNDMERSNFVTEIEPIASGNLSGYRITTQYATIEQFAAQEIEVFGRTSKSKGIQQRKGWFFDAYNFDFISEAPEDSETYLDNPIVQSMMPQIKFDMVINLPYAAEKNNAHNSSNEGKTLSWNLTSSITSGKNVPIQVQFKVWHKSKIALTFAAFIMLLCGTVYFFQKAKNYSEDAEEAIRYIKYMQICAGMTAAIVSASVFMLISPVEFTDADIISPLISGK